MEFVQVIEFETTRLREIESLMDQWVNKTEGQRKAHRGVLTADRDRPNAYVQIVEFQNYDEAMANSDLPATSEFAASLAKLCDVPPKFRNLGVLRLDQFS